MPESADQEVAVIHERIFDARFGQIRGQLRLPHPLREPQPAGVDAEATLQVFAHATDLFEPVGAGERREDRLVESSQQQLHAAIGGQPADHVEPCGVVLFQPLEQRTGDVQRQREEVGRGRALDDRPVDVAHVIGHDVVEIPDRLMQVQAEDESEGCGHDGAGWKLLRNMSAALPAAGSLLRASPS